ncbi:MAG: T9SS type A sorting domain-containing protein [bacterium]
MNILAAFLLVAIMGIPCPLKKIRELQKEFFQSQYPHPAMKIASPWNWNLCNLPGGEILGTFSNPGAANLVFAYSFRDVWRTTDGGATWELSLENCMPLGGLMSTPARGIVVDGGGTVWVTQNGGNDWTAVLNTHNFQTASFEIPDTIIYLVDSTPPRLLRSTNSGLSWQIIGTFNNLYRVDQIAHIPSSPNIFWLLGHTIPNDTLTYIYYSPASAFVDTIPADEVFDFQPNPYNPGHTLIATNNGIYQALSPTGPWTMLNEPLVYGLFQAVDIEFTGNDSIVVTSLLNPGIFKGQRQYNFWFFSYVESREIATFMSSGGPAKLYAGSLGKGVYKSTDNGSTWTIQRNNLYAHTIISQGAVSYPAIDTIFYFIGLGGNIYRVRNFGLAYDTLKNFLLMGSAIESAPTNPDFLIASSIDLQISGTTFSMGTIFTSTDGGANWTKVDSNYLPTDFLITSNPNIIIGLCDTFLIRSTTGGTNFTPVFAKPAPLSILAGCDTILIETPDSVFISYDQGATWQFLCIDPGGDDTDEISYDNTRKVLYLTDVPIYRYNLLSGVLDSIVFNGYANFSTDVAPNGNLYFLYQGVDTVYIARSFDAGNTIEQEAFPIPHVFGGLLASNSALFYYEGGRRFWVSTDITHKIVEKQKEGKNTFFSTPTIVKKGTSVKIKFEGFQWQNHSIKLYDISGRLVKNLNPENTFYENDYIAFSTKGLTTGVYFLIINNQQVVRARKLLIY